MPASNAAQTTGGPPASSWRIDRDSGQTIVALAGSMTFRDYLAADTLLDAVFEGHGTQAVTPARLIFDLEQVTMIDSHWLGMFVRALKRAEELGIKVVLRRAQPPVRRLLDLVQFDRVFQIER